MLSSVTSILQSGLGSSSILSSAFQMGDVGGKRGIWEHSLDPLPIAGTEGPKESGNHKSHIHKILIIMII